MKSAPPALTKFSRRLLRELRILNLLSSESSFIVAVSGGADSAALLGSLAELKYANKIRQKLIVAHFNHNLRGLQSDCDADFVERLARRFDCEFVCSRWTKSSETRGNLEQAARTARREFLRQTAVTHRASKIFTAHTLDDQAETVLMRLLRGSGAAGLSAMKPVTTLDLQIAECEKQNSDDCSIQDERKLSDCEIQMIRPFLSWARRGMTENFCRESGIDFTVDEMNFDSRFMRVRVRRELLPLLASFNPKIVETLARTANTLREDAEALDQIADDLCAEMEMPELIEQQQHPAIRHRVLRIWLQQKRGSLKRVERRHLLAIEHLLLAGEGGSCVQIPDGIVVKKNGKLMFERRLS